MKFFSAARVCLTLAIAAVLTYPIPSLAGSIKTWTTSERVSSADLNANFSHLHNTMCGSHGARLVNGDVSSSAAIAHTKLATPALLPKAWAVVTSVCDGAAAAGTSCTFTGSRVSDVSSNATAGQYRVNLEYSAANAIYGVIVTSMTNTVHCLLSAAPLTGTGDANGTNFIVECRDGATWAAATNAAFTFMVIDDNT